MREFLPVARSSLERGIDRVRRLAVVLPEQVGVDAQRDRRTAMPEPLRDRHHIDTGIDQLAGMGVA